MSSNIGPDAQKKYGEYLDAHTIDEKIKKLEEFISLVPKHKATEKIVALNRSKLAKLKKEKEEKELQRKRISSGAEDPFAIQREKDYIQIIMISDHFGEQLGAGKSTLLENLTGLSDLKIGVFTPIPKIGIYEWIKIKFQLIEMPALHQWKKLPRELAVIRTTDIVAVIIDLSRDPIEQMQNILKILESNNVYINYQKPKVKMKKTGSDGIKIFFRTKEAEQSSDMENFIEDMIQGNGVKNAVVKIYEKMSVKKIEMAFNRSSKFVPAVIIATKADREGSRKHFNLLKEKYGEGTKRDFKVYPVAISWDETGGKTREGLNDLGLKILKRLDLIRIYTKSKHGVAETPLVIERGATIADVAMKVHKELYEHFRYANVFRYTEEDEQERRKYRVGLEFEVEEFDIVEINSDL